MAPPVFSYFKGHHRRSGSSPSSSSPSSVHFPPNTQGISSPSSQLHQSSPSTGAVPSNGLPHWSYSPKTESPISPLPPVLPPIPRIASRREKYEDNPDLVPVPPQARSTTNFKSRRSPSLPNVSPPPSMYRVFHGQSHSLGGDEHDGPWMPDLRPPRDFEPLESPTVKSNNPETGSRQSSISMQQTNRPNTPGSTSIRHIESASICQSDSPSSSFSSFQRGPSPAYLAVEPSPASNSISLPQTSSRSTRSRMNLLNPVSLLMRRRTNQTQESGDELNVFAHRPNDVPAMSLPEDYDPRIKGKGVHDFSAPRTSRRNLSTNDMAATAEEAYVDRSRGRRASADETTSPSKEALPEKVHKTYFVEEFDADTAKASEGARRESLANPSFLARISQQNILNDDLPSGFEDTQDSRREQRHSRDTALSSVRNSIDKSTFRSSLDTNATSHSESVGTSFGEELGGPRLRSSTSRASRFSFQLQGERSLAQERALEEKAKARQVQTTRQDSKKSTGADSRFDELEFGDEDGYEYDDLDGDGLYEEEIPGLDAEEDDEYLNGGGLGDQRLSMDLKKKLTLDTTHLIRSDQVINDSQQVPPQTISQLPLSEPFGKVYNHSQTNDDMYFDDGMIEHPDDFESGDAFDESAFDTLGEEDAGLSPEDTTLRGSNIQGTLLLRDNPMTMSDGQPQYNIAIPQNLEAYHDALASAALRAEADGKFTRQISNDDPGSPVSQSKEFLSFDDTNYDKDLDDFNDDEEDYEEDDMIAEANAEALAADNSGFYGQEFGIEVKRSASGRNAVKEPNLTPITERSEFSTRNSFISVGGALPPFAPSTVNRDGYVHEPGLKDLMGTDEDEMTLSQLMKLRKDTFGGSARNSWAGSAGSNTSSPVNYTSGSPLAHKAILGPVLRSSFSEQEEDEYASGVVDVPSSNSPFNPHRQQPYNSHGGLVEFAGSIGSPLPQEDELIARKEDADELTVNPSRFSFQQIGISDQSPSSMLPPVSSLPPLPLPPDTMLQQFAQRPSPDAYRKSYQKPTRQSLTAQQKQKDIVTTYTQDVDPITGESKWYQERHRKTSTGGMDFIDRQLVEGGRI